MTDRRRPALPPLFTVTMSVATIAVFLQAVTAGLFVNQDGRDSWVTVHGVIADVTWVAALVAAAVGFFRLRRTRRDLWLGAAALFVLSLVQTGIGHLITERGVDGLIAVHVPLAVVIVGLAVWLMLRLVAARRATALDPYAADRSAAGQPLPVANRR